MLKLEPWINVDEYDVEAATDAVQSALHGDSPLSGFLGGKVEGGYEVTTLESEWEMKFGLPALAVNSATSGILAALKACGAEPGKEVIVTPYSMSAGVAAVVWCGAKPVFADIDDSCNLNPMHAYNAISSKTVAILTTNLFGSCANTLDLAEIANDKAIFLIEDNAQAPFARAYKEGPYGGTIGNIGVFSLNVHKPIQAGEGGMVCSPGSDLLETVHEIRNHGELSGAHFPGLNLRMTEVTAAIARAQLRKGRDVVNRRNELAARLTAGVQDVPYLRVPSHNPCSAYYIWHCFTSATIRPIVVRRLNDYGIPVKEGYVTPIHHLPAFKQWHRSCPTVGRIEREILTLEMYAWDLDEDVIDQIIDVFRKSKP